MFYILDHLLYVTFELIWTVLETSRNPRWRRKMAAIGKLRSLDITISCSPRGRRYKGKGNRGNHTRGERKGSVQEGGR